MGADATQQRPDGSYPEPTGPGKWLCITPSGGKYFFTFAEREGELVDDEDGRPAECYVRPGERWYRCHVPGLDAEPEGRVELGGWTAAHDVLTDITGVCPQPGTDGVVSGITALGSALDAARQEVAEHKERADKAEAAAISWRETAHARRDALWKQQGYTGELQARINELEKELASLRSAPSADAATTTGEGDAATDSEAICGRLSDFAEAHGLRHVEATASWLLGYIEAMRRREAADGR